MKTFLVRLWTSGDAAETEPPVRIELHGVVERPGAGNPRAFRDGGELLGLLERELAESTADGQQKEEKR